MASVIKSFVKYLFCTSVKCVAKDIKEYKHIKEDIRVFIHKQIHVYANVVRLVFLKNINYVFEQKKLKEAGLQKENFWRNKLFNLK